METRGTWGDLVGGVGLEIASVVNQAIEEYTPGINALMKVTSEGSKAEKHITGKTGSGQVSEFDGDGENMGQSRRYKTYTTTVSYTNYGQFIEVSKNQLMDQDYKSDLDVFKDEVIATRQKEDESALQLLNGGFATTTSVNGHKMIWYNDGLPQFSTIHATVVPGGSTQSNASSTGIKFGDTNLETGKLAMTLQKTDDGFPLTLLGKITIAAPMKLEKEIRQVIGSELVSENANNAINVYKGSIDLVTSPFLDSTNGGSDTAWYLTVPGRAQFYHEVRQTLELAQETNILNKIVTFAVDARWANYSLDWKRTWGSKGDLATYSS